MHARKTSLRLLTLTAGAIMTLGIAAPGASAATSPPPPIGSHIPATEASPLECESIPETHDPAMAKIVYDTGVSLGANEKVLLSAMETGWVESHMNNLDCGDKDSVGIFQQRPSQGWGTPEQCMDPVYASNSYYEQAIANDAANPDWTAGQVAQSVQRSAFPDRYDEAQGKAEEMIAEVTGA